MYYTENILNRKMHSVGHFDRKFYLDKTDVDVELIWVGTSWEPP